MTLGSVDCSVCPAIWLTNLMVYENRPVLPALREQRMPWPWLTVLQLTGHCYCAEPLVRPGIYGFARR